MRTEKIYRKKGVQIMKTSIISIAAVASALLMSAGAMAATLQPAAGEAPFMDQLVATAPSTLTRSQVEQQAAAAFPVSGNTPFVASLASHGTDPLTRAQVEAQAVLSLPASGQASAQPAAQNLLAPASAQASNARFGNAS